MTKRGEPQYVVEGRAAASSKLRPEDVFWIRENEGKESVWAMAQRFGVAQSTIRKVLKWETFQHLEGGGSRSAVKIGAAATTEVDEAEVTESLSRLLGGGEVKVEKVG